MDKVFNSCDNKCDCRGGKNQHQCLRADYAILVVVSLCQLDSKAGLPHYGIFDVAIGAQGSYQGRNEQGDEKQRCPVDAWGGL
jgi:hypothetical protein